MNAGAAFRAEADAGRAGALFPTGRGQSDTRAPVLSDGRPNPSPEAGTDYDGVTAREIAGMVADPPATPKEAARWFIPSDYRGPDARSHDAQRERGAFWFLALDVDCNDLELADVAAALDAVAPDCGRLIYATRSSRPGDRRWRALLPLAAPVAGADYADTALAFFDLVEEASDGAVVPDRALARPAQLVYLPNRGEHWEADLRRGPRLDLTAAHPIIRRREARRETLAQAQREAEAERARRAERRRAETRDAGESPVEHFNARHAVAELLARYGYTQDGGSRDWRSPMQSSKSYATRDFGDWWVSLSASDAAAGIGAATQSGHRFGDAFDLFTHFEHRGDVAAAVRAYAAEAGLGGPRAHAGGFHFDPGKASAGGSAGPAEGEAQTARDGRRFRLIRADALDFAAPRYLIRGILEADALASIFGDPGGGKTFVALDWSACIATGTDWHGRPVERGAVAYIAGEGRNGIKRRLIAWERATGRSLAGAPLFVSSSAAALTDPAGFSDVDAAIREAAARDGAPALIVVDTLARNFGPGDENATADMSAFVAALDALRAEWGATVVAVHHSGHGDKGRARGSSVLRAALDAEYAVKRDAGDVVHVECTKMKDAAPPPPLAFALEAVEVGRTAEGEAVTSAVLRATEAEAETWRRPRLSPSLARALASLHVALRKAGLEGVNGASVTVEEWRPVFYDMSTADRIEAKQKAYARARAELVERGEVLVAGDRYRPARPMEAAHE